MPVPGIARNRFGQKPNRFHRRPGVFVRVPGQTPGTMVVDSRADRQAFGTIRRVWRQAVNYLGATPAFSTTANEAFSTPADGFEITTALRYRASSVYRQAGSDNTRFGARRPVVQPKHNMRPVTRSAGSKQSRPTVRNRLISFGKRVPAINTVSPIAETDSGQ